MTRFFFFVMVISLSGNFVAAQSNQAIFDEANTYFESGELSQAMSMYRILEQEEQVSGALFLNMGIVAVQLDSMGLAKYYFLKSANFEETEERANLALLYVTSQFSRQSATLPKLPWDRAVQWMIEVPTAFGVFIAGFFFLIIGLTLLALKWLNYIHLKKINWYLTSIFVAGSLIVLLSFYVDYVDQRYDEAVLVTNSNRVLQLPEEQSTLVSIAYEGYSVIVDRWKSEEEDQWLYIRLGNGQFGWISHEGIKIL
ncbi:MAG: GW dipeptide domain-containing protein [Balneolaceae bacterium]